MKQTSRLESDQRWRYKDANQGSSLECRFANEAPTTWLQRVLTKFGQFLQEQRNLQRNFGLHHAHVLTLMQPTIPKYAASV